MAREVPYNPLAICDDCGNVGAFELPGGDQLCRKCIDNIDKEYSNKKMDDDDDDTADD